MYCLRSALDHAEIAQQRAAARLAAARNEQEFEAQQED